MKRKTVLRFILVGILMLVLLVVAAAVERSKQQGGPKSVPVTGTEPSR